ncbi:uncharacterized protein DUF4250 [Anaeroplasma bactoclasticum]|jgi:hypothetical protein|uniref:Uncharacterized protein DUF4250 n=1 Tax=Anaeroplasma bactoclasticum TaxID=2088 RepID=A0A397RW15_9MOLU|nr:DUF4250 domain-containing protein [Anaeroplasma bactoclasticum]RIA75827.1 uncharacterized protein DUF4250 [Anaeroplasma bactoclasticum]
MLPKNPNILLSIINTKLRDFYPSLEDLCMDMDESIDEIKEILLQIGYKYDSNTNQFKEI